MRNVSKKINLIVLSTVIFTLLSLKIASQDKDQIIGTWVPDGSSNMLWVFNSNGTLNKVYEGKIYKTFNFAIDEKKSENGKLTLSFLKLTNVSNQNDVYVFSINAISQTDMYLDYIGNMNTQLLRFTRK